MYLQHLADAGGILMIPLTLMMTILRIHLVTTHIPASRRIFVSQHGS